MFKNAKIGVWGLGLVGESLIRYFLEYDRVQLLVYDHKPVTALVDDSRITYIDNLELFLQACDYIFPSPGVDLAAYQAYAAKFKSELDLFYRNWHKPIIAITGTLGKTTLTTVLNGVLNQLGINSVAAGNIGLPMCAILNQNYTQVVLELSSFQLDLAQQFAPDLAVWTNFCDNHLDRHKTVESYFRAKSNIFLHQSGSQIALLPVLIIGDLIKFDLKISSKLYFFSESKDLNKNQLAYIASFAQGLFYLEGTQVFLQTSTGVTIIGSLSSLQQVDTYQVNLLILLAVLHLRKLALPAKIEFMPIAHRVEKFMTHNGIDWYNDSKSTVSQATIAAVHKLQGRPIILFLGGVSKGVDRTGLIASLKNQVKLVICFGGEAQSLSQICKNNQLSVYDFNNLESALACCLQQVKPGDQVLFSPAGASFDLFKNYVERGEVFKKLVQAKIT